MKKKEATKNVSLILRSGRNLRNKIKRTKKKKRRHVIYRSSANVSAAETSHQVQHMARPSDGRHREIEGLTTSYQIGGLCFILLTLLYNTECRLTT